MMLKNFAGPNFHASKLQITCYKMQGVTEDSAVFFVTLLFARGALTGLSEAFLFQKESLACKTNKGLSEQC